MPNLQVKNPKNSIKYGDIFRIGNHLLSCGDARDVELVNRLIGQAKVKCLIVDVPYGIKAVESKTDFSKLRVNKNILNDDIVSESEYIQFTKDWLKPIIPHLAIKNSSYIFNGDKMIFALRQGMEEAGLNEVKNPSSAFLNERGENTPGNVLTCLMEGTRPLLVEVQAIVNKTSFGYPVRKASGFDLNRLQVLIAVLQKRAGLALEQYDVHLNIVGGIKAQEPAVDLAVALAVASAFKDKPLGLDLVSFGEVGLSGEIRPVSFSEKRIKECENLGLKRVITSLPKNKKISSGIKILDIKNIGEIIKI